MTTYGTRTSTVRLPSLSFIDYFTLGVMYVLCASIALNVESYEWLEFLRRYLIRVSAWFWATIANLVAAETDASFAEAWRSTFYEGTHRRGNLVWRQRWASWETQAWPTLAAYGDDSGTMLLARPTICSKDSWKDLRERETYADNSRGPRRDREDLARTAARRAARRQVSPRPGRGAAPRRTLTYVSSSG